MTFYLQSTWNMRIFLPFELSSSLTYSSFPLEHTLIRPVQSGWSNFQSAALIKKVEKMLCVKKYSWQNMASFIPIYSSDFNNWHYIIWVLWDCSVYRYNENMSMKFNISYMHISIRFFVIPIYRISLHLYTHQNSVPEIYHLTACCD